MSHSRDHKEPVESCVLIGRLESWPGSLEAVWLQNRMLERVCHWNRKHKTNAVKVTPNNKQYGSTMFEKYLIVITTWFVILNQWSFLQNFSYFNQKQIKMIMVWFCRDLSQTGMFSSRTISVYFWLLTTNRDRPNLLQRLLLISDCRFLSPIHCHLCCNSYRNTVGHVKVARYR